MENFDRYVEEEMAIRAETLKQLSTRKRLKPRVYISGPMTGKPGHNHEAFIEAEKYLREIGFDVWNPTHNPKEGHTWEQYMKVDIAGLLTCDMIFMLPEWEESRGARMEKYIADEMKIPELKKSLIKLVMEVDFGDNY